MAELEEKVEELVGIADIINNIMADAETGTLLAGEGYHTDIVCHMTENNQLNNIIFFLFYIITNFSILNSCCLLL